MPQNLIKDMVTRSEKTLEFLKGTLQGIRTGRAHPALVEDIKVDYFGTPTPIKNMGTVSVPEARQILINPWDKTAIKAIEKAIQASPLKINPQNNRETIRLNLPELTRERRVELTKVVNKTAEEARIAIRNVRRDVIESLKKMEKESAITEDDLKKYQKETQENTDNLIKKVDAILAEKEKEIMEK